MIWVKIVKNQNGKYLTPNSLLFVFVEFQKTDLIMINTCATLVRIYSPKSLFAEYQSRKIL